MWDINYVEELVKKGYSKYRISKEIGVSWNTVQLWYKGVYKPTPSHQEGIYEIYKKTIHA